MRTTLSYRSRPVRKAVEGADWTALRAGLLALYDAASDTAGASERHAADFVRVVLEAASKSDRNPLTDRVSAKEFAQLFLDRSAKYSTTKAGISALLFETWLYEHGGDFLGRFLETVLESDSEYLAVFVDTFTEDEEKLLREKTEKFAAIEVVVRAGDRDYVKGLISDVTILKCKATQKRGENGEKDQTPTASTNPAPKVESLLPKTRDEYGKVCEDGGLSTEALLLVFGRDFDADIRIDEGGDFYREDANGVRWLTLDNGLSWQPDLSSVSDPRAEPAIIQETAKPLAARVVSYPLEVLIDLAESESPAPQSGHTDLYDIYASGSIRSKNNSWAVFEALIEGGESRAILVTTKTAHVVRDDILSVVRDINRLAQVYEGMPDEFDMIVEQYVQEYGQERGVRASNALSLIELLDANGRSCSERDARVHNRCLQRLVEASVSADKAKPEDAEDEGSDRMEDPLFYREDLQGYYDLQITQNLSPNDALARVRARFKVKGLVVTPAGEVRAPGIVDRPKPSGLSMPPESAVEPAVSAPPPVSKDEKPAEQVPEQPESPATESFVETSETRLPLSNLDDASLYWLVYEDGNIEDFNEWVAQYCPHLVSALQTWRPADSPLHEGSLERLESVHAARVGRASRPRGKRAVSESQREQHEKWCKLVNLRSAPLRSFLSSPELVSVLRESKLRDEFHLAKKASRWALAMRNVPVEEWTTEMWNWAGRSIRAISKLRGSSAPLVENGALTRKYHLLKTWGHDPSLQGRINAADVIKLQATGEAGIRRVNRLIDSLSGVPPFYVGEAQVRYSMPDYSTLKQHRRASDLSEARASGPKSKKGGSKKLARALADLELAPSTKFWLAPDWAGEGAHIERATPNSFVVNTDTTSEGAVTVLSYHGGDGEAVGVFSILTSGPNAGAFKVVVREDSLRQGIGMKLLDEAEKRGFDIVGAIHKNKFSESGRGLVRKWLLKKGGSAKSPMAESDNKHDGPTVWKSVVDGVTYYVSNTHRAYNVALSLDEALTNLNFISKTV